MTEEDIQIEQISAGGEISCQEKDLVSAHYEGFLLDGTKFDSSRDRGKPLDFVLGDGMVIKGWEEAARRMKIGERAMVTIPPHLAYGERGSPPTIPKNATLKFDMEIVKSGPKPKDKMEMNAEERIECGREEKETGNRLLLAKEHEKAINCYNEAVAYFEGWEEWDAEWKNLAAPIRLASFLNLANIYIRLERFLPALRSCEEALKMEPENTKALYRQGVARMNLGELELAKSDLVRAAKTSPQDAVIRKTLNDCREKLRERDEQDSKRYGGMFSKIDLYDQKEEQKEEETTHHGEENKV